MEEEQTNVNLTEKERNLIIQVLKDYGESVYSGISKKENNFIFNLIDKFLI